MKTKLEKLWIRAKRQVFDRKNKTDPCVHISLHEAYENAGRYLKSSEAIAAREEYRNFIRNKALASKCDRKAITIPCIHVELE